jgi:hypothetical protein
VQPADEDLLPAVVLDLVLQDLLDVPDAALPVRRLGAGDRRVEVEIPVLPFPPLDQIAVDQVVDVPDAEDHVELSALVQSALPDVAHHRDEWRNAGPGRDEHRVPRDRLLHHEATERTDRGQLRADGDVVEIVGHESAFDDLDAQLEGRLVLRPRSDGIRPGDALAILLREDRDELARFEVENRLALKGEADQIRLRILRRDVENFLDDGRVFARPELHRRLLDHGFLRRRGLRWSGLSHHGNAGTLQPDLNIVLRLAELRI